MCKRNNSPFVVFERAKAALSLAHSYWRERFSFSTKHWCKNWAVPFWAWRKGRQALSPSALPLMGPPCGSSWIPSISNSTMRIWKSSDAELDNGINSECSSISFHLPWLFTAQWPKWCRRRYCIYHHFSVQQQRMKRTRTKRIVPSYYRKQ